MFKFWLTNHLSKRFCQNVWIVSIVERTKLFHSTTAFDACNSTGSLISLVLSININDLITTMFFFFLLIRRPYLCAEIWKKIRKSLMIWDGCFKTVVVTITGSWRYLELSSSRAILFVPLYFSRNFEAKKHSSCRTPLSRTFTIFNH